MRFRTPESCTKAPAYERRVIGVRVDPRANRRRAEVDLGDQQRRFFEARLVFLEHHAIGAELLAEGHRHGVLQLGAPHFEHVGELARLLLERKAQLAHGTTEPVDREMQRDLHRGRIDVVGALAQVDVLHRMQVLVLPAHMAEELERPVGDHLVRVHVRGGARATLDHVDDELLQQLALADLLARAHDGLGFFIGKKTERIVRERRRLLHAGERANELRVDRDGGPRDREILQRPQRVDAVIGLRRHGALAQQIVLDANRSLGHEKVVRIRLWRAAWTRGSELP
jgi:hypothetical protein